MEGNWKISLVCWFLLVSVLFVGVESKCSEGCGALASYYVWSGSNLTFVSKIFSTTINNIAGYNHIANPDLIQAGTRLNVPFSCGCVNGEFMGHQFVYHVKHNNSYSVIAELYYSNLTTVEMMTRFNSYAPTSIPVDAQLNVTVNCSCGDSRVSKDYGLFVTYPLRPGESLSSLGNGLGLPEKLLQDYNPGVDFGRGNGLVFVPGRDQNGTYPPLKTSSSGISAGAIAGTVVAAVAGAVALATCAYFVFYRRKKVEEEAFLHNNRNIEDASGHGEVEIASESSVFVGSKLKGITVDKSLEFTFEELAVATNDFSMSHKIGQGGFGSVYYAELRGEKAAIKKMDMQASKEFLAELNVLTHVHHVNLVCLIGYCIEGSLFLVYEYVENGNLSQHLHRKVTEPLPWSARLQIALDSARGLEYIHEHTVPVYIHRDIKSPNILLDRNFRAKVADFGLAKLTAVGSNSMQTRLVGTFGYMPPEYAQCGYVSSKIDVYAFGVVLFELISAKEAIVKSRDTATDSRGLVALFEEAFNCTDQMEALQKLIDPRLDVYPLESVFKVMQLAKVCTHENPQLRPSMRSIVVALMMLLSSTEHWDIGSFYEHQDLVHLMSGR